MLGSGEQQAIDERQLHDGEHETAARSPRSRPRTPFAFVVLWWVSVATVIVGATRPGLGMAFAVGFGWLLWRYLPALGDVLTAARPPNGATSCNTERGKHHDDPCDRPRPINTGVARTR